jgi:hypothetical protein
VVTKVRAVGVRGRTLLNGRWSRLVGVVAMLAALGTWAVASPLGSTPDEDFHLTSIWCSHGTKPGLCEPGDTPQTRRVSTELLDATCYFGNARLTAACQTGPTGELVESDRGNFDHTYPPAFYYVMGAFAGENVTVSVLVMRLVNALIYLLLMVALYLQLSPGLRRALLVGALVTAVPLGVYFIPSINPTTWAILSGTTVMVSMLGFLTVQERRRRWVLGALGALAMVLGAGARADAAVYGALAVVAAVVLAFGRPGVTLRRLVFPAALVGLTMISYFTAGQAEAPPLTGGLFGLPSLVDTLMNAPSLWLGALGGPPPHEHLRLEMGWGLGARDTAMPAAVWLGTWSAFVGLLLAAMRNATRPRIIAVGLIALALLAVPAYYDNLTGDGVGQFLQPRYILPLLIMLVMAALVRLDGVAFRVTPAYRWTLVAVLVIANGWALYANLRRNVFGVDQFTVNIDKNIQWWWSPSPITPMMLALIGSLLFAVAAVLLTGELTESTDASREAPAPGTASSADGAPADPARFGRHAAPA